MPDILIQPAADADDDLTNAIVLDEQAVPASNINWQALGLSGDTEYKFRVLGTAQNLTLTNPASVPAQFATAGWSVATGSTGAQLDVTITTLPANNGATITDIQYDVNGAGSWTSLGGATTATYAITMPAAATSYAIRVRAVNSVGAGPASASKSATSSAAASFPTDFSGGITSDGNTQIRVEFGADAPGATVAQLFMWFVGTDTTETFSNPIDFQDGTATSLAKLIYGTDFARLNIANTNYITGPSLDAGERAMIAALDTEKVDDPRAYVRSYPLVGAWNSASVSTVPAPALAGNDAILVDDFIGSFRRVGFAWRNTGGALPDLATLQSALLNTDATVMRALLIGGGYKIVDVGGTAAAVNAGNIYHNLSAAPTFTIGKKIAENPGGSYT